MVISDTNQNKLNVGDRIIWKFKNFNAPPGTGTIKYVEINTKKTRDCIILHIRSDDRRTGAGRILDDGYQCIEIYVDINDNLSGVYPYHDMILCKLGIPWRQILEGD